MGSLCIKTKAYKLLTDHLITGLQPRRSEPAKEKWFKSNHPYIIKIIVRSFGSSKNRKLEDGPYCTISGNEPSSVTLYKTGSESQTFCCNFKNLHLCSLNQRLKFPKGPNNQNVVKKMILNI